MNQYMILSKQIAAHCRTLRGRMSKEQRIALNATIADLRKLRDLVSIKG